MRRRGHAGRRPSVAHLTTVDVSLRYLLGAQLRGLRDAGWEVIGISAPGPHVEALEREGMRHVALASSTRSVSVTADLRAALALWRILRRERPDVLHTHNPKPGVYGRVVGRMAGVPIVVNTLHGLYATETDPLPKRALVYGLEAFAARCSDAELVQNPEDLALMERLHLTRHARLLGNGVDLGRFDPRRFDRARRVELRAQLGLAEDAVVVGTVGRLVREKGYPELFGALELLPPDRYTLLVVGGPDPEKADAVPDELLARARARGARILGHRDDVDELYAAMDVFVLASHREGYPRAAMEAAASGLPVVATDIRGCRQVVEPGCTGLLVPVRDTEALAGAIRSLGDDPPRRHAMGRAARRLAEERFDERRVVRQVIDTYRETAARRHVGLGRVDVLQVVTSTDRRGAETSAIELAGALERRGLAVRTVALAPGASGGLEVPALGRSALGVHALRALRREAQRAGVVVAHGSRTLPACAIALLGTRVPFVYRNIGDPRFWAASPLRRARTRAFLARARAVVALTAESSSILSDRYGVAPARVTVIPNGVASARHRPADSSARAAARAALGLPNGVPVVAVIGALRPEKDVGLAIDAVACVEGAHLLVVGDGPERLAAEASAQRVAPGRVHFTGSLADPGPAFDAADVVALTSRTEGVPAVLVEAGLRAIPVVTTDVGFVRDVVAHGVTGLVVTQREPIALSVAIRRALASPDLGVAARRRCAERFDLEPVADAWAFLLDSTRDPRDHHSA